MQQHLMQMQPMMAAYYPNNVTSDHIQQYLDENKSLILKIVESQNSGKMDECAENQARLQRNLMYLAAIADSQPQPPALHSPYASGGMMQPGGHYMQQQQAQQMTQQSLMAARSSMLYSQQPYAVMQHQAAALHGQLSMSSGGGTSGGLNILQAEASHSGSSGVNLGVVGGFPDFGRNKHEMGNTSSAEGGRGGSTGNGQGIGDGGETLYLKSADDGN